MKTTGVKHRKKYSREFKEQVVGLLELGKTPEEVSRDMEISKDLLYSWRSQSRKRAQLGSGGAGAAGDQDVADELSALRRQVANLQLENDILKKAAVILGSKTHNNGTK